MKLHKSTFVSFLVACAITFSAVALLAKTERPKKKAPVEQSACPKETQAPADIILSFQNSRFWKKLDVNAQKEWLDAMNKGDTDRRFDCFVRVRWPADRGDESFLISKGFNVRFFSGTIATGHMKAKDMPDVAELSFVDKIQLSGPAH